jgi:hypothetical protein
MVDGAISLDVAKTGLESADKEHFVQKLTP